MVGVFTVSTSTALARVVAVFAVALSDRWATSQGVDVLVAAAATADQEERHGSQSNELSHAVSSSVNVEVY